jgi:spore coat protein CotH
VKVAADDVKKYGKEELYDPNVIRTIFLDFEDEDWEAQMADFKPTDVEVPAKMLVDGMSYENVGVGFRGASSFFMVGPGSKRSLSISMDLVNHDQRLLGYKSLNLLNSNGDGTLMRSVLYSFVANQLIPTPKVNLVRVVINGEDWGIYQNAQQFDKTFVKDSLKSKAGSRWKVPGSPRGGGGLTYVSAKVDDYRRLYSIKSEDSDAAWQRLILLCKTLNETPIEQLEEALKPMLDIDNVLKFLALDVALINNDGYWVRASDYNIFLDDKGIFKLVPHDMNETFSRAQMGPGGGRGFGGPGGGGPGGVGPGGGGPGGGGPGGGGPGRGGPAGSAAVDLDPLVGLDDASKPLRSKLLKVPSLRKRYLQYVYAVADKGLDWNSLGPIVEGHRDRVSEFVKIDTRKLSSNEAFEMGTATDISNPGREMNLKQFAEERRKFLMNHPEIQEAIKQ